MNIELRSISISARLSEETVCYTATLYIDGKKAGTVGNRGHGGPDDVHLLPGFNLAAIEAEIAKTHPPLKLSGLEPIQANLEIVCQRIVGLHQQIKQVRRHCRTKIVVLEVGKLLSYSLDARRTVTPADVTDFCRRHPDKAANVVNTQSDAWLAENLPGLE